MHSFEKALVVAMEDIDIELRGITSVAWSDFLLNPRRLRGSDFLMRWSQGEWSEKRLVEAVNRTKDFFAIPYGPSGTAPSNDVKAFELYFERLDKAGLGNIKRPDLLVFSKTQRNEVKNLIEHVGGISELPFTTEDHLEELVSKSVVAVECENSLWKSKKMPDYQTEMSPQKRLGGKLGLKKTAVLPTIILKEEDLKPLAKWQRENKVPIHIWHVFFDQAFGIAFDDALKLFSKGLIEPTKQVFQAPGGATTAKVIYKIYYHYGYPLGESTESPRLQAAHIDDKNGHILPYVKFEGGKLELREEALTVLSRLSR